MPHAFSKIWVHAIWATKYRNPLILPAIEEKVYKFIAKELRQCGCFVRIVNGMPDHIHCLFLFNRNKTIADVIHQIKGSSSHYINEQKLTPEKFAWQTGYASFSVSESALERVFQYIKNQKPHHLKKSSKIEYSEFLKLNGFIPPDEEE